jgi:hypothetical protein
MDTITRRRFLVASGVIVAAGAAAYGLKDILDTAGDRPAGAKTLVLVTLYGGNDGLNTVIPYADPAYAAARTGMAYPADRILHLDDEFGLNPGLAGLHKLYGEKKLAVVRGVGYPKPDPVTSDRWTSGRPPNRPGPAPPAGSAAGWMRPAATRAWPSRSNRSCRRCWPARPAPARPSPAARSRCRRR